MKRAISRAVLDRIPEQQHRPAWPFAMRRADRIGGARQFVFLLVGRIDQDKAALFLRRNIRIQCGPAVDRDRLDAGVTVQVARRARASRSAFEFAGDQPVLRTQPVPDQKRGAGIAGRARHPDCKSRSLTDMVRATPRPSALKRCCATWPMPLCHSPPRRASSLCKIGETGAGMGVDHAECGVLLAQMRDRHARAARA